MEPVNAKFLAQAWDLTVDRVYQLQRQGVIKKDRNSKYNFAQANRDYIRFLRRDGETKEISDEKASKTIEKMDVDKRHKLAMAKIKELELKEFQGKLHRSEDVEQVFMYRIMQIRGMLLAMPGKLAMDCASAMTPNEASNLIRREVNEIMQYISECEYDPEEYAKLVRERRGWEEIEPIEEDGE